ncbi:hypothetical protein MOF8_25715 [Methylobacterium oryzae]
MTDRPIAFDLTRLVTRLRHASPSGIDRVDLAYARAYLGDIVLNIKTIAIRSQTDAPKRMTLRKTGPGLVTAGDIGTVGDIQILNPDLVICTLDDGAEIRMEFTVATGKGYVPACAAAGRRAAGRLRRQTADPGAEDGRHRAARPVGRRPPSGCALPAHLAPAPRRPATVRLALHTAGRAGSLLRPRPHPDHPSRIRPVRRGRPPPGAPAHDRSARLRHPGEFGRYRPTHPRASRRRGIRAAAGGGGPSRGRARLRARRTAVHARPADLPGLRHHRVAQEPPAAVPDLAEPGRAPRGCRAPAHRGRAPGLGGRERHRHARTLSRRARPRHRGLGPVHARPGGAHAQLHRPADAILHRGLRHSRRRGGGLGAASHRLRHRRPSRDRRRLRAVPRSPGRSGLDRGDRGARAPRRAPPVRTGRSS